jgi:hypothetical protein
MARALLDAAEEACDMRVVLGSKYPILYLFGCPLSKLFFGATPVRPKQGRHFL